jgi:hypothetical protein
MALAAAATPLIGAPAGIALVGRGFVSGDALDKSGLTGDICRASDEGNCVPKAIFGGFGSDVTFTGQGNVFVSAPDRGPFDGLTDVPFLERLHYLQITTEPSKTFPNVKVKLLDTRFLSNETGKTFVGAAGSFVLDGTGKIDNAATLRLDPEGIRVGYNGNIYISDEYGPYIFEFNPQGELVRRIAIPEKFFIANPSADPNTELANTAGRQANRGMEGLAITPDGSTLIGIMQNALIQDNGLSGLDRLGINNRILTVDLATGTTHEYVYQQERISQGLGINDLLAINDHEFLVIERDNRSLNAGSSPNRTRIYKIDLTGATDVSGVASLPAGALPSNITPVRRTLFIDLLDPAYGLNPTDADSIARKLAMPEKLEALAWGADLSDGRHLL